MSVCLVLGANGFIGSHLVDALVAEGHRVRAFDRPGRAIPRYDLNEAVEAYYGDFLNMGDVRAALQGVEYVFHFISTTTPASAENDPLVDVDTNIRTSIELFQHCVESGVKRVLFASTGGAIYGENNKETCAETDLPQPVSPYAIGKLTIEHYLRYFKVKHGLDSITFRISNPYGERQPLHRKQGVIPIFLENIAAGRPLSVMGDGSMVRDYLYVKDVAVMVAMTFDKNSKHIVYNLGSGKGLSVNDLVAEIEAASGKKAVIEHVPVPPTFVRKVVLNTGRFAEEFGVTPQVPLADGLEATLAYISSEMEYQQ